MIKQAKEELQILEAQHPDGFDYLKLELKSFIFLLEFQQINPPANSNISFPVSSTATTRASSTSRKRKKCSCEVERATEGTGGAEEYLKQKLLLQMGSSSSGRRDRIDVVMERAQACLHKIQKFKTSFLIS